MGFFKELIVPGLQEKPDYWCMITVPNEFQPVGKYNIGLTAGIETTVCDIEWIKGCNKNGFKFSIIRTFKSHVFQMSKFQNSKNQEDSN